MKILYYSNWNVTQLSYLYPILKKYGGSIYCNDLNTIEFIKNSNKYKNHTLYTEISQCELYNPEIVIYTQYPDYIVLPEAVHVMIDHGPDFKPVAYSYDYDNEVIKKYDIIPCSGQFDIDSYKLRRKQGNFKICGCPKSEIVPEKINIFQNDKKIILYAPSWTNNNGSITRLYDKIKELSKNFNIFILPHYLLIEDENDKKTLIKLIKEQHANLRVVCRNNTMKKYYLQNNFSIYFDDFLDCCMPFINYSDVVITDMSSIIGETLMLNKPIYITEEKEHLTEELIIRRILLNKTEIMIYLPTIKQKNFDINYIFDNKHNISDYIVSESMKLSKK